LEESWEMARKSAISSVQRDLLRGGKLGEWDSFDDFLDKDNKELSRFGVIGLFHR
jgi:hypothetical protein